MEHMIPQGFGVDGETTGHRVIAVVVVLISKTLK